MIRKLQENDGCDGESEYTLRASLGRLSIQHDVPSDENEKDAGKIASEIPAASPNSSIKRRNSGVSATRSSAHGAHANSSSSRRTGNGRDPTPKSTGEPSNPKCHPLDKRNRKEEQEHEPKSAFHLILGERFAVEDIWQKVAAEEQAILAALEEEEDKAMHRIRMEESKSLKNVQRVWMERQKNVAELGRALEKREAEPERGQENC